jgi:hypothetical protein
MNTGVTVLSEISERLLLWTTLITLTFKRGHHPAEHLIVGNEEDTWKEGLRKEVAKDNINRFQSINFMHSHSG